MKTQIYEALKSGKKFEEVAKLYGSTDAEKNSAGVVMGSPVLPDAVYDAIKGKKKENIQSLFCWEINFMFLMFILWFRIKILKNTMLFLLKK